MTEARREEHGNQLVLKAIKSGDEEIEKLAADDLPSARKEMLRREEEQRQQEERLRRETEQRKQREMANAAQQLEAVGSKGPGGAPAPGPRMR